MVSVLSLDFVTIVTTTVVTDFFANNNDIKKP